jgi:glycerophosphoryl diester phosphodiesterase
MLVIGHRGASAAFAENTAAAFLGAIDQGADGVELDVRRTLDGALALSHDDTLRDGTVVVETAMADLPPSMIDLSTALALCEPLGLVNIEIKNWPDDRDFDATEQLAAQVVALLAERGELEAGRNLISCFHLPTVDRVHELAPALPTAWLLGLIEDPARLVEKAAEHGHAAVHPHHLFVDQAFVDRAHAAGLQLNPWTCNDPDRLKELEQMGVDAVVTDVPDVALRALGR